MGESIFTHRQRQNPDQLSSIAHTAFRHLHDKLAALIHHQESSFVLTVNEYFEGQVKSIGYEGSELPATVGVMSPGEYTFATNQREYMTVVDGELLVKLPGSDEWKNFLAGDTFIVEARQSFDLQVAKATAYLCKYED